MAKLKSRRAGLIEVLNRASREAGGLGVMFGAGVAKRLGISQTDLECIDIVSLRGRMTAGELASASGLTTGAVTGLIDRLEKAGFARREPDPLDRRKVHVTILPKALALGAAHYRSLEKAMNALIASYDDRDLMLLAGFFGRTRDIMLGEIAKLNAAAAEKPAGPAPPIRSPRRGEAAAARGRRRPPRR